MRMKLGRKGIAVALSAVGLLGINDAIGHSFLCDGVVWGGTIDQNVVVPTGANCILNAVTVNGNIGIRAGGEATLNAVMVNGNIDVKSDDVNGEGELYFGVIEGGEGRCFSDTDRTSNVSGNIAVKGSKNTFAGFGIGSPAPNCPAVLNLGKKDNRANLSIDRAHVYQGKPGNPDTINVYGNVSVANSDRDGLSTFYRIYSINVINTTAPSGKTKNSNMSCKNNIGGGLFAHYTVGGNLSGDNSCFP